MKIYLGADHRGFELGKALEQALVEGGAAVEHVGANALNPDDDYVDFGAEVGRRVASDSDALGIVVCGSGVGMDIAANKIKGVRAFLGYSKEQVRSARNDDDVNVLALGSDFTDIESAKELTKIFTETPFDSSEKRVRRVEKIKALE